MTPGDSGSRRGGGWSFAPSWLVIALTLLVMAGLVSLGAWQVRRMQEKQALFAAFAATAEQPPQDLSLFIPEQAPRWQRAATIGRYDSRHQFLLDNLTHQGRPGYQVITPLVIDEARTVLVNRGWVPAPALRSSLPDVRVMENERSVVGVLNNLPAAGIALEPLPADAAQPWPRVLNYPKLSQLEAALGRPVFPRVLQLDPDQPDGFVREWQPSTFGPQRHLGYALTWFALAATVFVIFIATNLRRTES